MLNYLAGVRWYPQRSRHWFSDVQLLMGGSKVTHTHLDVAKKDALLKLAAETGGHEPPLDVYLSEMDTNGLALRAGGGLSYQVNDLLVLRVANLAYQHSLSSTLNGSEYSQGLRFSFGLAIRLGPWREP